MLLKHKKGYLAYMPPTEAGGTRQSFSAQYTGECFEGLKALQM